MSKYIFRLDDIAENMKETNYLRLKQIFLDYNIQPIIGVIPDNQDLQLLMHQKVSFDFWDEIRKRQKKNDWTIALHGYTHVYETSSSGLLKINNSSEFSGLTYIKQKNKINKGLRIFKEKGIKTKLFMAPSHSFDKITIDALNSEGIKVVTDGYGLYPYEYMGLTFIPQLFSRPKKMPFGIYTWCLHLNTMSTKDIDYVEEFIKKNQTKIISAEQSLNYKKNAFFYKILNKIISITIRSLRSIKK